jgi:hypothetical protein
MSTQRWTSVSRAVRITVQSDAYLGSLSTFIKRLFILFSLGDARRMVLVVGIGKRRRTVFEASQQGLISNDLANNRCVREGCSPRQVKVPQHLFLCLSRAGFLTVSAQLSHLHQGDELWSARPITTIRQTSTTTHWKDTMVF